MPQHPQYVFYERLCFAWRNLLRVLQSVYQPLYQFFGGAHHDSRQPHDGRLRVFHCPRDVLRHDSTSRPPNRRLHLPSHSGECSDSSDSPLCRVTERPHGSRGDGRHSTQRLGPATPRVGERGASPLGEGLVQSPQPFAEGDACHHAARRFTKAEGCEGAVHPRQPSQTVPLGVLGGFPLLQDVQQELERHHCHHQEQEGPKITCSRGLTRSCSQSFARHNSP